MFREINKLIRSTCDRHEKICLWSNMLLKMFTLVLFLVYCHLIRYTILHCLSLPLFAVDGSSRTSSLPHGGAWIYLHTSSKHRYPPSTGYDFIQTSSNALSVLKSSIVYALSPYPYYIRYVPAAVCPSYNASKKITHKSLCSYVLHTAL